MTIAQKLRPKTARFPGLSQAEVEVSREKNGINLLTPPEKDPWWQLFLEKFDDPIIRILIIAAIIAIAIGFVDGNYVEGLGIIAAILLATTVAFINEYKANREFDILNQVNDEIPIQVIRDRHWTTVPKKDIVVGDIVSVEAGDEIPADGRVLEALSLQINEANLTGESNPVTKVAEDKSNGKTAYSANQVLRSTIVDDGYGIIEITAVGDDTEIGKTARDATADTGIETPLNIQLDRLSRGIGVLGFSIAILIDIALVFRGILAGEFDIGFGQWYAIAIVAAGATVASTRVWLPMVYDGFELAGTNIEPPEWLENDSAIAWLKTFAVGAATFGIGVGVGYFTGWLPTSLADWIPAPVAAKLLGYFTIAVAVIVVAVPEGLALSVTLSLAYSMGKMTEQHNLVRQMHACETIGASTIICSDKTGTLTENKMLISEVKFPCLSASDLANVNGQIVVEAMCANSTANLEEHRGEASIPLGDRTEGALLLWLEKHKIDYTQKRGRFAIAERVTFSPERKYMATLGVSQVTGERVLYFKGAPELLLASCDRIFSETGVETMERETLTSVKAPLKNCETKGMRTLGFAYLPEPAQDSAGCDIESHKDLIWLGFVAIADPVRPEVPEAVKKCQQAGVEVKMITGDSLLTAIHVAREINISTQSDCGESYITGSKLESMDDKAATKAVKQAKVIARARPHDKQRIVQLLQASGEVVAVTGDGTNDAPALNQAQVGLSMGSGTFVAKEASDIVILDDSFGSIENAVMWGRSLYQNIQKFILFQLTINVAACGIALLGPFVGIDLPLTVTQLLWVNLIMDTFAALALATEPPSEKVMEVPPRNPEDFIISKPMAVSIFTVGPIFLVFLAGFLFYIQGDKVVTPYELSLFFTTFVMLQFWNIFNAKCFGLKESAFASLGNNWNFLAIAAVIFVGQILMVQFGGQIFRTVPLSLKDWLLIISSTSVVLWIGEIWRFVSRLKLKRKTSQISQP